MDAKAVSEKTTFTFSKSQPAEFSTASSFNRSVLDPADISSSQTKNRTLSAASNQKSAYTFAAQPSSIDSARSQCSGAACASPRRVPVDADTGTKVRLFKLGVEDSALVKTCTATRNICSKTDGELVEGATFALYEGTEAVEANKVGDNFAVDANGFEISGLQVNKTYTLKEVAAPAGYTETTRPVNLFVDAQGKAIFRGYRSKRISVPLVNNEFYFPNLKVPEPEVWLFKLGVEDLAVCSWGSCSADNGELLGGAEFALYEGTTAVEANKVGDTFTVGQDGLKIPGLQVGKTYTLKEVAAPENYDINPATYTFEVDADGKAKYQTDAGSEFFVDNKIYFPNQKSEPAAVTVKLFKLGVTDPAVVRRCTVTRNICSKDDGELVEGATFALYEGTEAVEAKKVGEFTVDSKDGFEISGLQVGKTYTLKEVAAPENYDINPAAYTFEVDADGKAKYQTDNGSEFFVDNKIYFPNQKSVPPAVKLKLFKLGVTDSALVKTCTVRNRVCTAKDGDLVGGARFALYKGAVSEANKVGEYTVGEDGLEISGLQVGKNYTLKEVAAPAGYILNPNSYTLMVEANGRVGYRTGKIIRYPNGEFYIPNLKVQTIDISLNKVSDEDTPLENVKFDLYEADNLDKPVQNLTTGNDGKANLTVTPGLKYRLVETQTVSGFALLPQAIEFQVAANGTVTIEQANGNVNTVTGGDKTLKVVNYPEGKLPLSGQSGFLLVLLSGLSLLLAAVAISRLGRKRN
ncbi:SpaA isopeptide-forming pilin-related protein [uncultured Varibaculum sp.]|uniref:SpaA isopeptide-forming pilin-related protein n=1 Tax=uncultured Varibaculum sp. TaxID=413896 RepID=UPI00258A2455|nr:SpaA isopeptide-forming pilin-related protein [uncultured Varibaculum sp.]